MDKRPVLWWKQPDKSVLSFHEGYNRVAITFSCDKNFTQFFARVTKDGEEWGKDIGELVPNPPMTDGLHDIQYEFEIVANNVFKRGDGTYRVGMYVQDTEGYWNLGQYFLVKIGGSHQNMATSDNDRIVVKD